MQTAPTDFYHTSGTLRRDAPSYVTRTADEDLFVGLQAGKLCYVLTSRQMGKSSLMVRTAIRLRAEGVAVAVLDLTGIGKNVTAEQWYGGMLELMGEQFDLEDELEDFWQANKQIGPMQRWMGSIRDVVMKHRTGPVVIFVDEIDAVRNLDFSTDEFFAGIREFYNRRTEDAGLKRLTFCLLGVAMPSDLIQDARTTPFNVGSRIELTDFAETEASSLAQGLNRDANRGSQLLDRILYWTGGHPYLTQCLCRSVADDSSVTRSADVDRVCEELFLSARAREHDNNLVFVRRQILETKDVDRASLLDLYQQVRKNKRVPDDKTNPLVNVLRLAGITSAVNGYLFLRNRIYHRVFDQQWIIANMPDAELQRQRAAYRKGMFRAAAIAAVIVALMAGLSIFAFGQKRRADRNAAELKLALDSSERQREELQRQTSLLEQQRQQLVQSNDLAVRKTREAEAATALATKSAEKEGLAKADALEQARRADLARASAVTNAEQARLAEEKAVRASVAAEENAQLAHRQVLNLYEEQGRQEILQGDNLRALPYLSEAYSVGGGSPSLRFLLAHAISQVKAETASLEGHSDLVSFAGFSPDGDRIVTGSADGTAKIWDVKRGTLLRSLDRHFDAVTRAVFSPDGTRVVTASSDATAIIWNVADNTTLYLRGHQGSVNSVEFSPSGDLVVTASSDGTAIVWDADGGKLLQTLKGHTGALWTARFSPAGDHPLWVVTAGSDKTARVWDAKSGKLLHTLSDPAGAMGQVLESEFSHDGAQIAIAGTDNLIRVWETESGKPLFTLKGHASGSSINSVKYSPDGQRLVTTATDGTAKIWNARNGSLLVSLGQETYKIKYASFSPDGSIVATAGADGIARVWEASSGVLLAALMGHSGGIAFSVFSADGQRLVTTGDDGTVKVWLVANMRLPRSLDLHTDELELAAFSPNGTRIVTASHDNTAHLWDPVTTRPVGPPLRHDGGWVLQAVFSPDSTKLVTTGGTEAKIWNATDGSPLVTVKHDKPVIAAAFDTDGKTLATGTQDGHWFTWDVETGAKLSESNDRAGKIRSIAFHPFDNLLLTVAGYRAVLWKTWNGLAQRTYSGADIACAAISHDGRRVLLGGNFGGATITDLVGNQLRTLSTSKNTASTGPETRIVSVEFSPDDKRVVTTGGDRTARIWDSESGVLVATLDGHTDIVRSASFSLDGNFVVTASDDHTAKVWDATNGKLLSTLAGHAGAVRTAYFSPDGGWVLTAGRDNSAKLWDVRSETGAIESAPQVAALVNSRVPFHLEQGQLLQDSLRTVNLAYQMDGNLRQSSPAVDRDQVTLAGKYAEQGRRRLLEGDSSAAAVWLGEAYTRGANWESERFLLHRAARQFDGLVAAMSGHRMQIQKTAYSPDGSKIVTVALDRSVKVWRADNGELIKSLAGHTDWLQDVNFSQDGTRFVTAGRDGQVRVWDAETYLVTSILNHETVKSADITAGKLLPARRNELQVLNAVFSPDGNQLLTACDDGVARLWETRTGEHLRSFGPNATVLRYVAFSPNAELVATAGTDGTLKLWNTRTGELVRALIGHTAGITSLSFRPDGKQLLTAGSDRRAILWDVASGATVHTFAGRDLAVFSPGGERVATEGDDNQVDVWDTVSGAKLLTLKGHEGVIANLEFRRDGERLLTTSVDRTAKLWDLRGGALIASFEGHNNSRTLGEFSPDGTRIVTVSGETVRIWTAEANAIEGTRLRGPSAASTLFARLDADLQRILMLTQQDQRLAIVNQSTTATTARDLASVEAGVKYFGGGNRTSINSMVVLPFTTGPEDPDDDDPEVDATAAVESSPENTPAAKTPAGLVTTELLDQVTQSLSVGLAKVPALEVRPPGTHTSSPDAEFDARRIGQELGVQAVMMGKITRDRQKTYPRKWLDSVSLEFTLWDTRDGSIILQGKYSVSRAEINGLASSVTADLVNKFAAAKKGFVSATISQDAARLATGAADGSVAIWDVPTRRQLAATKPVEAGVGALSFSPDGQILAFIGNDQSVRIWNYAREAEPRILPAVNTEKLSALAFSPKGDMIITAGWDKTARLWGLNGLNLITTFSGHKGNVSAVHFIADGTRIITSSEDGTAKIWDIATGKVLVSVGQGSGKINDATISPDGAFLATGNESGSASLWDIQTGTLLANFVKADAPVDRIEFSPDGQQLLIYGRDGEVWLWNIERENRSPAVVAELLRRFVPFTLDRSGRFALPDDVPQRSR